MRRPLHGDDVIPDSLPIERADRFLDLHVVPQGRVSEGGRCARDEVLNQSDRVDVNSCRFDPVLKFKIRAVVWNVHQEQL